jgi:hypothetical protein
VIETATFFPFGQVSVFDVLGFFAAVFFASPSRAPF